MDNILVAVDGSKYSERVVEVATEIAKKTSSAVILTYVIKSSLEETNALMEFERIENVKDAYAAYLQDIGTTVLSRYKPKFDEAKISCQTRIETGNPAEMILKVAEIQKPKYIVLGLRGLHGLARIRSLGSIARRVIENSECPVIVVGQND